MRVWVVCTGEVLPIDRGKQRPLRAGMLCSRLVKRGHEVVWFSSTFNHARKQHRCSGNTSLKVEDGLQLRLLHGCAYDRNVSVRRLRNHLEIALQFRRVTKSEPAPDILLCAWPTIELGRESVRYSQAKGVPVALDVRDLWPDLFLDAVPKRMRMLAQVMLTPYYLATRAAFRKCSAIIGSSEEYLAWGLRYAERERTERDGIFELGYEEPTAESDQDAAARGELRALGVDPARTICWFLGTFGDTYDLQPVLDVARELHTGGESKAQIVISGDGDRRKLWEGRAAGLTNVVFTGWLNGPQIGALMKMAGIGLAAYRAGAPQSLPNKIFEYMAAGVPILSSLPGECAKLLRRHDCGESYRAGDSMSLLQALRRLVADDELRRRLGTNAGNAFRRYYSASHIYGRMADHLEWLAATGKTGTRKCR